jgi:hypothetical protein
MKLIFIKSGPSAMPAAENSAVDGCGVPQVNLDPAAEAGGDRRVVQVDDLSSESADDLGCRGAHTGRTSDYQRPLAVVAELLDTSHFNPLWGRQL